MRNPSKSTKMVPGLRATGARARDTFTKFVDEFGEKALEVADLFGTKDYQGPPDRLVDIFRADLRTTFDAPLELREPVLLGLCKANSWTLG